MHRGMNIEEFSHELNRQQLAKKDFVVPGRDMAFVNSALSIGGNVQSAFPITKLAHDQLAVKLGIPKQYYDRLRTEVPDLLGLNINLLMGKSAETQFMVRALDNKVRAILSPRYLRRDNYDVAQAVMSVMPEHKLQLASAMLTETNMYLKFVTDKLQGEVKKGDVVRAGICIRNSEVGLGTLVVEYLLERLVCLNGAIMETPIKQRHAGRTQNVGDDYEAISDETRKAEDRAFFLRTRDIIKDMFDPVKFYSILDKMKGAAATPELKNVAPAMELAQKSFNWSDQDRNNILNILVSNRDLTQWGFANAITQYSQQVKDYEEATNFERLGGRVIEMTQDAWGVFVKAA